MIYVQNIYYRRRVISGRTTRIFEVSGVDGFGNRKERSSAKQVPTLQG